MAADPRRARLTMEHLELALQTAGLGEFQYDVPGDFCIVSERMAAITGGPSGYLPADGGRALLPRIHPDDLEDTLGQMLAGFEGADRYEVECRAAPRPDHPVVWLRIVGQRIRDDEGDIQGVIGIVEDITARKVEEQQRHALMAEIDHRVKNVLATVQALAVQTAKRTSSMDGFLQTFLGRLKSMGSANELLTAARWRGAAIDHLVAAELGGLAPSQTRWAGPELFLTPRAANALSLALHELATNALKYGALSVETGQVDVAWRASPSGGFTLDWTESGGPVVSPPLRTGFGATLLSQVTRRELNGQTRLDFPPTGARAFLEAGAAAVVARPDTIPETPARRAPETAAGPAGPVNLAGARVLIVEDAALLAMELETGLSEAGALVVGPAYELEEALALLDQPLDANLNGLSVSPVAEILAERGVPFVFATGYGDAGGAPSGFDAPVIRKPYDVTQVTAAVADLLTPRD
ncbi:MAG: HWE histidine kinase domain-containing protein [Phenylobacterium sp.]|uniref:HWE histidine kinase domain-containing protein n=1 Tax=Phenylobacterium sp. TaxID=1871053 RepID=UPI00271C07EC|nr:HWE histidine kinase domain-containing protein [Phenylobacterium sp.]MDO8901068.1 HWE histidine kinase domain-containing protein [Phenylobacterium sp.]